MTKFLTLDVKDLGSNPFFPKKKKKKGPNERTNVGMEKTRQKIVYMIEREKR